MQDGATTMETRLSRSRGGHWRREGLPRHPRCIIRLGQLEVKGAMYVGLETKGEPVQASPLTVAVVGKLEAAVLSARDPRDRIVAGFVAFCVHARLRVGDALRISREPLIDLPSGTSDGFIEVSTHKHKTRARGSQRLLPIIALSNGIKVSGWAAVAGFEPFRWLGDSAGLCCRGHGVDQGLLSKRGVHIKILETYSLGLGGEAWHDTGGSPHTGIPRQTQR